MTTYRRMVALASSAFVAVTALACGSFSSSDTPAAATDGGGPDGLSAVDGTTNDATVGDTGPVADGATVVPVEIANGYTDLEGLAVTDSTVFVIEHDAGRVFAIPIAGGPPAIVDSTAGAPLGVAIANGYLYWSDFAGGTVKRRALAGGQTSGTTAIVGKSPFAIAPASDRIVVLALGAGDVGEVQQYPFDLATAGPSVGSLANPFDVAVYGGIIYWTESSSGRIGKGLTGTSDVVDFSLGETDCQSIAADATGVYWTRRSAGIVRMKTALGLVDLSTQEMSPHSLVADGSFVYWLTGDGKLRRASHAPGSPVTTLTSGFQTAFMQMRVRALAHNAQYLVWITTDGRILRVAK